jgi:hypothetical protein
MNPLAALLAECASRGISLRAGAGGKLLVGGRRADLTPSLINWVKESKRELLQVLSDNEREELNRPQQIAALRASENALTVSSKPMKVVGRRLIGSGFAPIFSPPPPVCVLADSIARCPRCGNRRVLAELRRLTRGWCYECWSRSSESHARR